MVEIKLFLVSPITIKINFYTFYQLSIISLFSVSLLSVFVTQFYWYLPNPESADH